MFVYSFDVQGCSLNGLFKKLYVMYGYKSQKVFRSIMDTTTYYLDDLSKIYVYALAKKALQCFAVIFIFCHTLLTSEFFFQLYGEKIIPTR